DQTLLPIQVVYRDCHSVEEVWEAIKTLRIRGAPAIGVAAAMGVVVGLQTGVRDAATLRDRVAKVCEYLASSRPTAVNLFWALDRMRRRYQCELSGEVSPLQLREILLQEALTIESEDQAMCRAIGANGAALVPDGGGVLTHCNAGGLAT